VSKFVLALLITIQNMAIKNRADRHRERSEAIQRSPLWIASSFHCSQ
jgi:hypothetical protein